MTTAKSMTSVVPSTEKMEEEEEVKEDGKNLTEGLRKLKTSNALGEPARSKSVSDSSRRSSSNKDHTVVGDGLVIKKFKLYECILYCVFMILFLAMVTLGRSYGEFNYHASASIEEALEGDRSTKYFAEISNPEDFWTYVIEEFIPNILVEEYDNGEEITDPLKRYYVAETNLLMGGFRIGQKRVAPQKCTVPDEVKNSFHWCYPAYTTSASAKNDMVIDNTTNFTVSWQSHDVTQDSIWRGRVTTYDGHGYVVDFPRNLTEALERVNKLRAARFVDEQTRAIFLDFNTYNPVYNLDTIARLVFEFPPTGGIWPYFEVKSWQFRVYFGIRGKVLLGIELTFWIFFLYYLLEEICEILSGCGWSCGGFNQYLSLRDYWSDSWNRLDVVNLMFFFMYAVTRIVIWVYQVNYINWEQYEWKFYSFRYMQRIAQICSWILMVNGFLLFIKLFKYFTFSPKLTFLVGIMKKTYVDIFIFMVAFMIIMFGFALMGYIAFSSDVYTFRTFGHASGNLIQYLLTDMDIESLMNSNKYIGNIYYIVWSLVMILVLSNVFIAILCDAYSEVQEELKESCAKFDVEGAKFFKRFTSRFSKINKDGDRFVDAKELKAGCNVNAEVAEEIIKKYAGEDGKLDHEEYKKMQTELNDHIKE